MKTVSSALSLVRQASIAAAFGVISSGIFLASADPNGCEARQMVFYYMPGDASLSETNEALAARLASQARGCVVKGIEVEAFSDARDGDAIGEDLSSARAQSVLSELGRLGLRPHETTVHLHVRPDDDSQDAKRFLGRKAVVTINMERRGLVI